MKPDQTERGAAAQARTVRRLGQRRALPPAAANGFSVAIRVDRGAARRRFHRSVG